MPLISLWEKPKSDISESLFCSLASGHIEEECMAWYWVDILVRRSNASFCNNHPLTQRKKKSQWLNTKKVYFSFNFTWEG